MIVIAFVVAAVLLLAVFSISARRPAPPPQPGARRPARAPQDVIRFEALKDPDWRMITSFVEDVLGEQHHRDEVQAFAGGEGREIELVRQPDNPHDANALAVFGSWEANGVRGRGLLGYVRRELAAEIAARRPADLPLRAGLYSIYRRGDFIDIKLRIYEPSARSAWWKARGGAPPQLGKEPV